jgi:NADH-quinone oxidoreductase subunit F
MREVVLDSWGGVERRGDTGVKPELLQGIRAIAGWGGLIILDRDVCIVELIKSLLEVVQKESCGKCTPCRVGTRVLLDMVSDISIGKGASEDIDRLYHLSDGIKDTALCVWGETAQNAVSDSIKFFREEYEAHLKGKRCQPHFYQSVTSAPCQNACPAYCDPPSYIEAILERRFSQGRDTVMETIPLPGVLGRVCFHPCENACQRNKYDEPIAICQLKRVLADEVRNFPNMEQEVDGWKYKGRLLREERKKNPKAKVAIVGSGPAGLAVAYYLSLIGYRPTVFESLPVLGGMLRVGIPDFRLPQDILDEEIQEIADEGVEFKVNTRIGEDFTIDDLFNDGYEAVFVAVGAHRGLKLGIPGEEEGLNGYVDAASFLRRVSLGDETKPGDKVVVIGGGSVAFDALRDCLRIGCAESHLAYRRTKEEAPAGLIEIHEAEQEGAIMHFLAAPLRILSENGQITGIELQRMEMGPPDERGRRAPVPIEGATFVIECDSVVAAIGQEPETEIFGKAGLNVTKKKTFEVNPVTFETNRPGVFAAGDAVLGPATVVEAIGTGHRAALHMDRYLNGDKSSPEVERKYEAFKLQDRFSKLIVELTKIEGNSLDAIKGRFRERMLCIPHERRVPGFMEIECGFPRDSYIREALRCTRCYRSLVIVPE